MKTQKAGLFFAVPPQTEQRDTATRPQFKTAQILCPEVLAHAERLAEALKAVINDIEQARNISGDSNCIDVSREALAAWEGAQK